MHAITTTLIISVCIAIIYWLDAPNDIASRVMSAILGRDIRVMLRKPLGCNTCMTFWVTLVVLLVLQPDLWWLSFLWAWAAKYLHIFIEIFDKVILKIFTTIDKWLNG